jgi:hypothetical protein
MHVHGDAAAIILDSEAAIDIDLDLDVLAIAGQRLIDTVVDQFVDQMVQALGAGVADVHSRTLADVGRVAEDLHAFRDILLLGDCRTIGVRGGQLVLGNTKGLFTTHDATPQHAERWTRR